TGYLCDLNDDNDNGNSAECLPSVCGNGVEEIREVCDNGSNTGAYGGCMPGCQELGPRCGDGITTADFETCDDGEENGAPNKCNNTCSGITPSTCNNLILESGEACDDPNGNSDDSDGACRTDCTVQRCGDGITDGQNGEACDAGSANGSTTCGCDANCQFPGEAVSCRGSGGDCDVAEVCNGAGVCPEDVLLSPQTECRAAVPGGCDIAETCTGETPTCPSDAVAAPQTECRAGDLCDPAEVCNGETAVCPDDAIQPDGFECRGSVGLCDIAETCNGVDQACPGDVFQPSNIVCADKVGGCDVADLCDGMTGTCPTEDDRGDAIAASGDVCRQASGLCDIAELCDGTTKGCADNALQAQGFACRPTTGDETCDPSEICDGMTGSCPSNSKLTPGAICGTSMSVCATDAVCGDDLVCDPGMFLEDNTICVTPSGQCSDADCSCQMGVCEPLCGNGVLDDHYGEACDSGDLTGARDYCNLTCQDACDNDFGWAEQGGGLGRDDARDVDVDEAGNSYTAGTFEAIGQVAFGPQLGPGSSDATFAGERFRGQDSTEGYIMKYDTDENPQWASCIIGYGQTNANGIAAGRDGSVFAAGRFDGSAGVNCCEDIGDPQPVRGADVPSQGGCQYVSAPDGSTDNDANIWVGRWSADGDLVWATSAGSHNDDSAFDIAVDRLDRVYVVGEHNGNVEAETQFSGSDIGLASNGSGDGFVAQYTAAGELAWARTMGGGQRDLAVAIALDGQSNAYVAGDFRGTFELELDGTVPVTAGNTDGSAEVFVTKLDPTGTAQWAASAYSVAQGMGVQDIAIDGSGNSYVVGSFRGEAVFGAITVGAAVLPDDTRGLTLSQTDIFVAKLDPTGAWAWVAIAGDGFVTDELSPEYNDLGFGLSVDRSGKVLVTGSFQGFATFGDTTIVSEPQDCEFIFDGPSEGPCFQELGPEIIGGFSVDGFNAKLSATGEWLWAKGFGGGGEDRGFAVDQDPKGNAYVVGLFSEAASFGQESLFAQSAYDSMSDAFVSKMLPDGAPSCYDCGDGVVDPGEGCDDDDMLDHCGGACDGICFGGANDCGDGWVECGEDFDAGGGADLGPAMCLVPRDPAWCFEEIGDPETTLDPIPLNSGLAMRYGPGLENPTFAEGNADRLAICPILPGGGAGSAASAEQWDGDAPPLDPNASTQRVICDGIPGLPVPQKAPSFIGIIESPGFGGVTMEENAAIECGDYYEFVGNTGADPSFEFDERSSGQEGATNAGGPQFWSLWVSPSGAEGTFDRVVGGNTTRNDTFGGPPPYHSIDLSGYVHPMGSVANSFNVYYRLYAWGSPERTGDWDVDNVRVGPITNAIDLPAASLHWAAEFTGDNEVPASPAVAGADGASFDRGAICTGFDVTSGAYVTGDTVALEVADAPTVTVSAWAMSFGPTMSASNSLVAGKWGSLEGDDRAYGLFIDSNGLPGFQVNVAGSNSEVIGMDALPDGQYANLTGVYDGARAILYVNGTRVAAVDVTGAITDASVDFGIGGLKDGTEGYAGLVDEVRVFSEGLTATQIQALVTRDAFPRIDCPGPPTSPTTVFINEIHYDDDGTDAEEGVEIAGPAGASLAGWSVILYNGNGGASYKTTALDGSLSGGFGAGYAWFAVSGIQNGSPDGLALVDPAGTVIQLLSYEGTFMATNGLASGMISVDVGVNEASSTPDGSSLQLTGSGCEIGSFTWAAPAANTRGAANAGQTFSCPASAP
ncbi:MAG: hypothetical protein ACI9MR_003192, partial [Myxococcota bacterium]